MTRGYVTFCPHFPVHWKGTHAWQPTEMRIAEAERPPMTTPRQAAKRPVEQADDDWADSPILRDIAE